MNQTQFDMMSEEEEAGRGLAAATNPLNISGTPFNFNHTQGNISALLNNSTSYLGLGALVNGLPGAVGDDQASHGTGRLSG